MRATGAQYVGLSRFHKSVQYPPRSLQRQLPLEQQSNPGHISNLIHTFINGPLSERLPSRCQITATVKLNPVHAAGAGLRLILTCSYKYDLCHSQNNHARLSQLMGGRRDLLLVAWQVLSLFSAEEVTTSSTILGKQRTTFAMAVAGAIQVLREGRGGSVK